MKLYYSPLACSLAAHIALREAGVEAELIRVDLPTKRTSAGGDLFSENPMGQVPTLVLPDGRVLVENVAILSFIHDYVRRAAPSGDSEAGDRYEHLRWLALVSTEVHKRVLFPIYASNSNDAVRAYARESAARGLGVLEKHLESRDVLFGETFGVADAYLFWALTILPHAGVDLGRFPVLRSYRKEHRKRPAVHAALTHEKSQFEIPFAAA